MLDLPVSTMGNGVCGDQQPKRRAVEQRATFTPFQLAELHPIPTSQDREAEYRIAEDQSVDVKSVKVMAVRSAYPQYSP
jgi:hypothetical protein